MYSRQCSTHDRIPRTVFQEYTKEVFNPSDRIREIKDKVSKKESCTSSSLIQDLSPINYGDNEIATKHNENNYNDNQNKHVFQLAGHTLKNISVTDFSNYMLSPITETHGFRAMSVYMSDDLIKYPLTSTPKKPTIPKDDIPKLNAGEMSYMKGLGDVIREWMKTLPIQLDDTESIQFKEVIINDLAGNIVYEVKKHQLATSDDLEYEVKLLILSWVNRFTIYGNTDDKNAAVDRLYTEILKIPIPSLILPQHGTRKKMKAIQFQDEYDSDPFNEYIPKGIDVIEDEISMWMNEQPEKIYMYSDRISRNNMIHKLAEILEQHLLGKHTEIEIEKDVAQWLHEVIKPDEKIYIDQMIEELLDRVKNLPQEATLREEYKERLEMLYHKKLAKENAKDNDTGTFYNDYNDPNETMKEFLEKFIQHNYDIDDSLAQNAFSYMLKKELVRINPPTRKEIYENFAKSEPNTLFAREKFIHELEYIKLISDWLRRIPVTPPYNNIKNKHRIYFIHNLAKYINEIEDERAKAPDAMDYDLYLYSIIRAYIASLPISTDEIKHIKEMNALIVDLVNIIMDYRYYIQNKHAHVVTNDNNLGEFINEFIHEHGKDIRDDPLKLEVWTDRIMIEIQKIVRNTSDPTILGKTQLYKKLSEVPIPEEESIEQFNTKLIYVKEISDWLKNLPLKDVLNQSDDDRMVKMISDLAERMIDRRMKILRVSADAQADTTFVEFLNQWIITLPLDTRQEIIVPVVMEQLMSRMDRVSKSRELKVDIKLPQVIKESSKKHEKSVTNISTNKPKCYHKNPENAIIEAVEKFCNALPIEANNENVVKSTKDEIAKRLLQKISTLNIDPIVFNDALLLKEIFGYEVDMVLENVHRDSVTQNNKKILKKTLVNTILELENVIREQTAGETYKQNLENTIEASIPNPVETSQIYDPGFEFYKSRLVTMFIMENFDHANEDIKLKYEKRIEAEVDRYFEYAQNRNAIPLSKDRIHNDLYGALFKVPIPSEASIAGEVEKAKTRFEIDAWYELLPLIPAHTLDELLERDRILSTLAKRIHEIERTEKLADPFIHKEILKWLTKLPLLPGNEQNLEGFANNLHNRLKSTTENRKCVSKEIYDEMNKGKSKANLKSHKLLEKNQLGAQDVVNMVPQSSLYNKMSFKAQKPAADLILEVVEIWCNQLPIPANTPIEVANARNIKDNLAIKIVLKISELNSDPEVFNDEYEYDAILDQEIAKLTHNLPIHCDYQEKEARKFKLKEQIRSIKPAIKMERDKHEYKDELEQTVSSFFEVSNDNKKVAPHKELIENIVDDFIEYYYNKDDVEERIVHKMQDAVVKHLSYTEERLGKELARDPLIIRNELICQLSKVPAPSKTALQNIITEMRMKKEVEDLFSNLSLHKKDGVDMETIKFMKLNLTKKLCELEINGHNPTNDDKMRNEITKCLKKLDKDINSTIINGFVDQLRNNYMIRKMPPRAKSRTHDYHRNIANAANQPRIYLPTVIRNESPTQIISGTVSSLPKAWIARRELELPSSDIPRSQIEEEGLIEVSNDNKTCKCAGRNTNKRKRVCIARRNFGYNHVFRKPMIPIWSRFPRVGFYY